jgi:ABC-type transport system involved in multi-copper enzyme maturation permease subunit
MPKTLVNISLINISLVKYVLKACVADKIIWAFMAAFAVLSSVSMFLGDASVIEQNQFSLVFCAGSLRLAAVLGIVLFIVFFIRRSFESRDIELLLSRPLSKLSILMSYAGAFSILAILMASAVAACVYLVSSEIMVQGYVMWSFSLISELLIVAFVAFFFASLLSSAAVATLMTLMFYMLGRMMGQLLSIIETKQLQAWYADTAEIMMQAISMLVPRFDLMGQTSWLLYDVQGDVGWFFLVMQPLVYNALIFTALAYDFNKKQF